MLYRFDPKDNLHGFYVLRTREIYKAIGHNNFAGNVDKLAQTLVIGMLSVCQSVEEDYVLAVNSMYSQGQKRPAWLYWELVSAISSFSGVEIPDFYRVLASGGAQDICLELCMFYKELLEMIAGAEVADTVAEYISEVYAALEQTAKAPMPLSFTPDIGKARKTETTSVNPQSIKSTKNIEKAKEIKSADTEAVREVEKLDTLLDELDSLIGLEQIKKDVRSLINLIKVRKLREENDLPVTQMSLHMVFTGNPGTGKTTVARLLARLYHSIGVLSSGTLVEVDRSGLVAGYVGQTAVKTSEAISKAKGGILFIDEAYSLAPESGGIDFGREAIEIVLKSMEDNRENLVVIAAGYDEPMERFISSNPGLESRFGKYFNFPDYNGEELYAIFTSMCEKSKYTPDAEASEYMKELFNELYENRGDNFGNARDVRNFFEKAIARHSDRVALIDIPSREDLVTFIKDDFLFA